MLNAESPAAVIVLAAGEGTRMRSTTPKPLHPLSGRTLLGHALAAAAHLKPDRIVVVVRHGRDAVAAHAHDVDPSVVIADQDEIPGTGRAVQCALEAIDASDEAGPIVVLPADCPLLDGATLANLVRAHREHAGAITILTAQVRSPDGYGRIIRDEATGEVARIVEERDATPDERLVGEINSSVYAFDEATLRLYLRGLSRKNAQGEVLLTDVVAAARSAGRLVRAVGVDDPWIIEGVNDRAQLARLGAELNRRITAQAMLEGATIIDPATTWIDVGVKVGRDCTILPGTHLAGATVIEDGAVIGPDTTLRDTLVGAGAVVERTHATKSVIGEGAKVGPWTHLRPGTVLGPMTKAGSYVEIKAADIGAGAKVPHLSYVGDATVGEGANIGAATIFANYDGITKSRTVVGRHARVGSDTILVAPVEIGDGAYTGAGAVIRQPVPPGALAVNDVRQRNILGWVERRRSGSAAASAATVASTASDNVDDAGADQGGIGAEPIQSEGGAEPDRGVGRARPAPEQRQPGEAGEQMEVGDRAGIVLGTVRTTDGRTHTHQKGSAS